MTTDATLKRIADGRTDLVFEYLAPGHTATQPTSDGVRLLQRCANYGDVSVIRFLVDHGESLTALGSNLGLIDAAFMVTHSSASS